jgi:hypothetical protein
MSQRIVERHSERRVKPPYRFLSQVPEVCLFCSDVRFHFLTSRDNFNVDCCDTNGRSVLMKLATMPNRCNYAKKLIRRGANIHLADRSGSTFLHLAAENTDSVEMARTVIAEGADVDCQDGEGKTPLYVACQAGNLEYAAMLLYFGANPSISSHKKITPIAAISSSVDVEDQRSLQDILYFYTFDNSLSLPLPVLTGIMSSKTGLFERIVRNVTGVTYDIFDLKDMVKKFASFGRKNLDLFLDKFQQTVEEWIDKCDMFRIFQDLIETHCRDLDACRGVNLALDLLLGGKHGYTMVQLLDKSFCGVAFLVQLFHKFERLTVKEQEKMVTDRALWMILYGLKVHLRDLEAVHLSFGYCILFEILLHLDVDVSDGYRPVSLVWFYSNPRATIEECEFGASFALLGYFNYEPLKKFWSRPEHGREINDGVRKQPKLPSLVELSRNVAKKYIVDKYGIRTSKRLHFVLNALQIDWLTKDTILLKRRLY